MGVVLNFLLSQAIVIPVAVAILRIKKLDKSYYPFFILLLMGLFSEVSSFASIELFKTNAPVIKIYSLVECCLILYQLYLWKNSTKARRLFVILAGLCIVFWVIECIVFLNINTFSPYFRVFYAFVIVLLSINQINSMMFQHNTPLFKNPKFIICLAFIVFFLYQIIYEASYYISDSKSDPANGVANKIIIGFGYINFIINLTYAVAIYFMTAKSEEGYNHYFKTDR
jgi:hypothetical protein